MVLTVAVLGPLEVTLDGDRVDVPSGKTSELVARLALDAGVLVRADRLVDDLWATGGVTARRNTLQSKVAMLRRALGDHPVLESRDGGYALAIARSDVDALAVLDHAVTAAGLLDAGDARGAADLCESSLNLYRGEALQAAGDGDWVGPYRTRLEEIRLTLLETEFSARLQLDDGVDLIGELEAAVATHPFQERLWELLITAQYRAGRQADALATYQRVKHHLADELGLEPRPQLRQFEQRILTQDASLDLPFSRPGLIAPSSSTGNLPSMSVELVGRASEVAAVSDLLANGRLVEIVGPGGVGKTAMAVEVGRSLTPTATTGTGDGTLGGVEIATGGVWLARLETARTASDVVDALISALDGPASEAALLERLKGANALVILDNCEHVIDAAAGLAIRLLDAAPDVRILCTSQTALDIDGEAVFELAPLSLINAAELFTRRATAQRLDHAAAAGDAVLDLCRSLDGLPLAIELAAARTRTLSVEEITRRLDDRFTVLSSPTSRKPERRRALKATIRWSYDLLFPDDQRGLWALASFAGGASLPAVEFVLEALEVPSAAAIDVVGRLASRSLVIVDDEPRAVRYRLLDSIRAFALEAMADAERSDPALAAHAAWFANAARFSTPGVRSARQAEHLAFAQAERANIDAALAWSVVNDPMLGLEIVNGFGWAWVVLGDSRGAERILAALTAVGDNAIPEDRANSLLLAAWIEASAGDLEPARRHIDAANELADALGDMDLRARCCYYLAYVVSHHGDFREAMDLTDRSRALYEQLDRPWDQAANALFAARAAISAADQERSLDAAGRVQRWLLEVEDPWLHVRCDAMLGELARIQHRFDDAVVHLGRAAETSRHLGFQQTEAYQLTSLARAQCQAGNYDAGVDTLERAIGRARATGDLRLAALARVHLGRVLRALGHLERARAELEVAAAWHREAGGGELEALGRCLLVAISLSDNADDAGDAEQRLLEILDHARKDHDAPTEVFALDALARTFAAAGDHSTARDLCRAADARMEAASHFITDLDRVDARWVKQHA